MRLKRRRSVVAVPIDEQTADDGAAGILVGMTMTTIKVPKATRDRLHRLAAADGVTLAQEIDKLISEQAPRPRPKTGGFRSDRPLSAEEIDRQLASGFGDDGDHR